MICNEDGGEMSPDFLYHVTVIIQAMPIEHNRTKICNQNIVINRMIDVRLPNMIENQLKFTKKSQ